MTTEVVAAARERLVTSPCPEPFHYVNIAPELRRNSVKITDLPEALLEIHARTGFAQEFTHLSEGAARVGDLSISVCAVLLAEACTIGLEPVVRSDVAALTRGRLNWIQQNYFRAETLTRANATLVDTQSTLPLAQAWGEAKSRRRMACALSSRFAP